MDIGRSDTHVKKSQGKVIKLNTGRDTSMESSIGVLFVGILTGLIANYIWSKLQTKRKKRMIKINITILF